MKTSCKFAQNKTAASIAESSRFLSGAWLLRLGREAKLEGHHNAAPGQKLQRIACALRVTNQVGTYAVRRANVDDVVIIEEIVDAELDL